MISSGMLTVYFNKNLQSLAALFIGQKVHLFADFLEKYHRAATVTMVLKRCNFFKLHRVNLYERADFIKRKSLHYTCTRSITQLEIKYLKHHTIRTATQATTEKLTNITYGAKHKIVL